jgi:hypothetical protein
MPSNRRSESLFGDGELKPKRSSAPNRKSKKEYQDERKKIQSHCRNDYMFKGELQKAFQSEVESRAAGSDSSIVRELETIREAVHIKERNIVARANRRRKRHYLLNGDIVVYCYIKNNWPKLVVKPLTIELDEETIPSIDGYNKENELVLKATFKPITIGIRRLIDPFIFDQLDSEDNVQSTNYDEYKRLAFVTCFKSWNIPIEVEFEEGRVSDDCWSSFSKIIHPKLFDVLMAEFISLNDIQEKEIEVLEQQCERLFAKKSSGVNNPIEGIRLYCEASTFAKEFSLSGVDLNNLSYRIANMMRYVSNKGNEIQIRQMDQAKGSSKKAKVAKPGRR